MMSDKSQVPQGGSRRSSQSQESIDWKQCILCQSDDAKKGILVHNPRITSYEHVLEIVQERANLSDGDFVNVQRRLQNSTPQTLEYNMESPKLIITSASGHTRNNKDLYFEDNNHEKADRLLIHQAVLASQRNPSHSQLVFFSPDTDVLVLVTANYDMLLKNTSVSMKSVGCAHRRCVESPWSCKIEGFACLPCLHWG